MTTKIPLIFLVLIFFCSCRKNDNNLFKDFEVAETLNVTDSILLDKYDILNPHYIYCKDSFLIFNSIQGSREIQLLNLRNYKLKNYSVIGQGRNEMSNYFTVSNVESGYYKFADNQRGKIYGINLDSLQQDTLTSYELLYSLPINEGLHFFRFLETEKLVIGIGILQEGRFGVYKKPMLSYVEQMGYPNNEDIDKLDNLHKGALFSRTLLAADKSGKRMVSACFGLLDFYTLSEDGKIVLNKTNHYHYPKFTSESLGGGAIAYKKEDFIGITGLISDEKYVYVLYSDKTFKEDGEKAYNASHLLVFDWFGNPVKHYSLQKKLYGITLLGNMLYGLSREDDPIVYCCKLSL